MTDQEHEELDSKEWPTWKCAAMTGALCGVPLLLPLLAFPLPTLAAWATLILLYLGMIKVWGAGFVIHGATSS